jgi:hypothetical protein
VDHQSHKSDRITLSQQKQAVYIEDRRSVSSSDDHRLSLGGQRVALTVDGALRDMVIHGYVVVPGSQSSRRSRPEEYARLQPPSTS